MPLFKNCSSILKNRVNLSGSYGLQHNNISATRSRTTRRTIGSANLSVRGGKHFNFNAAYSNFGITMQPRSNLAPTQLLDAYRLSQISQAISVSSTWSFASNTWQQSFDISANYNALDDLQP